MGGGGKTREGYVSMGGTTVGIRGGSVVNIELELINKTE